MSKIERNAPCPCGSGKKYKQCCMKTESAHTASPLALRQEVLQEAIENHQAGRLSQARLLYQKIIQSHPHHSTALHFLGVIELQSKNYAQAVELINQALLYQPQYVEAHSNLALALQAQGKYDEAIDHYQKALNIKPDFADALYNLGNALKESGNLQEAAASYRRALVINPHNALAHYNLGNTLKDQNLTSAAVAHYQQALSLQENYAEAHGNLGLVLVAQGMLKEGIAHYRQALAIQPNRAEVHNNLSAALQLQGQREEAILHSNHAILLSPNAPEAHNNLGNALKGLGKLDEALLSYRRAIALKADYAEAHNNLGNALKDMGRLDEAAEHYRKALEGKADNAPVLSNLLYALNFQATLNREEVYRASLQYEQYIGLPLRSTWQPHLNDKSPTRRLRVGYVSPDFRNHAVAYFAEPILSNHDKTQVEVYCYAEVLREDEITLRFRHYADHWHTTVGMSDEAMAQLIREHQIDILVDLAGHTANNRLPVFARKPAPIQMSYVGYLGTTGLSAMDYILTDHYIDPDRISTTGYSERALRMPHSLWCYRPSGEMPAVSALPALTRGYLTFGSFNNFNKINLRTLELWAAMLQAIPTSRLLMLAVAEGETQQRLKQYFSDKGIAPHRLDLYGSLPLAEYRRKLLEVDLTLDPVTVNGATTTCESLWMGVPVISLVGERFPSRAGLSILNTVGLADFAVTTSDDYIHLAAHLAENLALLAEIRAGLRAHVAVSPLIDEVNFTRHLELLYREVWQKWCDADYE